MIALKEKPVGEFDFVIEVKMPVEKEVLIEIGQTQAEVFSQIGKSEAAREIQRAARDFRFELEQPIEEPDFPIQLPSSGTGFFISRNLLATNAHVVGNWETVQVVLPDGKSITARVVRVDEGNDLAILRTESHQADDWLPLDASIQVKLADEVFTLGFPNPDIQGREPKYTDGKISSLSGMGDDPRFYQVTIPVQPGNSGGPLVDREGRVIGVITARLGDFATFRDTGALPQNVNYAVKIPYLLPMLDNPASLAPVSQSMDHLIEKVRKSVVLVMTGGE